MLLTASFISDTFSCSGAPPHFPNTLLSFINFMFAMNAFASFIARMFFTAASRCGWHFLVALIYKIEKVFWDLGNILFEEITL